MPFYLLRLTTKDTAPLLADRADKVRAAVQAVATETGRELHGVDARPDHLHAVFHLPDDDAATVAEALRSRTASALGAQTDSVWSPGFEAQRIPLTRIASVLRHMDAPSDQA